MLNSIVAQADIPEVVFNRPAIDWHAVAPELILLGWGALVTLFDIVLLDKARRYIPTLTGLGFLVALVPVITLWNAEENLPREMFGGGYVVDQYSLVLKGLFLLVAFVVVLMSSDYLADGDYYDSEYYQLISASVLGMIVMTSARDLISIFIAIELVSIPAYLMAAWRKSDYKSNEAGLKYMLMGVFATSIMLYGMSLLYGISGSTLLDEIGPAVTEAGARPLAILAILFTLVGFAFKVSAVPFHSWAPDTYEGAPTPLTAFLAVASKTAGFVALMNIIFIAFDGGGSIVEPFAWILSALTMTVGNLLALRQTNLVRMLAYSGISQAGYMIAPFAVYASNPDLARSVIVNYLLIYAAMTLGAFAVVIVAARKTGSAETSSFGGMFQYAPGLVAAMTLFLISLAGIPPVGGGWLAKFRIFEVLLSFGEGSGSPSGAGISLAIIAAVNSVIAAYYYFGVAKQMWFQPVANNDSSGIKIPPSLQLALAVTVVFTLVSGLTGILPDLSVSEFGLGN